MSVVTIELEEDLLNLLPPPRSAIGQTVREILVLELYRRGEISHGKGAELLGTTRELFIRRASGLGIAYLDLSREEWMAERDTSLRL